MCATAPAKTSNTTQPPADGKVNRSLSPYNSVYWDWDAQDEAAYQEFKGMWEVSYYSDDSLSFRAVCTDKSGLLALIADMSQERVERLFGQHTADFVDMRNPGERFGSDCFYYLDDTTCVGEVMYNAVIQTVGVPTPAIVLVSKTSLVQDLAN